MQKYKGNMLSYLNEQTKAEALGDDEGKYEIEMIDARKIITNKKNFYGIRDVESLARRMAFSNNITPLVVVPLTDGNYQLISGERRRAAVLYRFKSGEIDAPLLPCIKRKPFHSEGKMTREMIETINIICENDYRQKNIFEKLQEVLELEPIARIVYDEAVTNNSFKGPFRKYFAENFLGISSSSLQRILVLQKLIPAAMDAVKSGLLSETAASELAYKSDEEQHNYLARLSAGEAAGTVSEIKQKPKTTIESDDDDAMPTQKQETDVDTPLGTSDEKYSFDSSQYNKLQEKMEKVGYQNLTSCEQCHIATCCDNCCKTCPNKCGMQQECRIKEKPPEKVESVPNEPSEKTLEQEGQTKLFSTTNSVPVDLSGKAAEQEANEWVICGLQEMAASAAHNADAAKAAGQTKLAAQWALRKAAVDFIVETVK